MTRVNVIPAKILLDQHLRAELREIPRIITNAYKCNDIPNNYVLGTGHQKFFYDKLEFIYNRIIELNDECDTRGFKVLSNEYLKDMKEISISKKLYNNYYPDINAIRINAERILDRVAEKPYWYRMCKINLDDRTWHDYKKSLLTFS